MKTVLFVQHMFKPSNESEYVLETLEKEGWELHEQITMHNLGVRLVMKKVINIP